MEKFYSVSEFRAAQQSASKINKGFDPQAVAKEIAEGKRCVDQKIMDAIASEGITDRQFDILIDEYRTIPTLMAAASEGDRAIEPKLESLLLRLDPQYIAISEVRETMAKHLRDYQSRMVSLSRKISDLRDLQRRAVTEFDSAHYEAEIQRKLDEASRLQRETTVAEKRFLVARDNCLRYMRGEPSEDLLAFERALSDYIEQEIEENMKAIERHSETIATRTGQLREIGKEKQDPTVTSNCHRLYTEEIEGCKRHIESNKILNGKLKAWLAEIQPAELAATL